MTIPNQISHSVLVTGGSRGIGRAICIAFGKARWKVAVQYLENSLGANETCQAVTNQGGKAFSLQADISRREESQVLVRSAWQLSGALDVLVCNAGVASSGFIVRMDSSNWEKTIATNLTGTFFCIQAVAELFLSRGKGSIIVVGSYSGIQGNRGQAAYAASKAGLVGLIKSTAREFGRYNVAINGILPGWQPTDMTESVSRSFPSCENQVFPQTPSMEEVAHTVVHLSSLSGISGQIWNLDSRLY